MICVVTFFLTLVVDVLTELARDGVLSEMLYVDDWQGMVC